MNENREKPDIQIIKRTFEYTLQQQEELRDTLMTLIKEDRCLSEKERSPYFQQLSRATIGLGRDIPYSVEIEANCGKEKLGSVEYMARFLGMQSKTPVQFSRLNSITQKRYMVEVPIGKLWEALLYDLFAAFPLALDRSSSMSKEHEQQQGGESYGFESV
jgi:hypothetical protein